MKAFDPALELEVDDDLRCQSANRTEGLDAEPMSGNYWQLLGIKISRQIGVFAGGQYLVVEIIRRGWYMSHVSVLP